MTSWGESELFGGLSPFRSKTFEDEEKLPFVLTAGDAKTLWKELNKATRVAVKNM